MTINVNFITERMSCLRGYLIGVNAPQKITALLHEVMEEIHKNKQQPAVVKRSEVEIDDEMLVYDLLTQNRVVFSAKVDVRLINCLKNENLTVGRYKEHTQAGLLKIPNFGNRSYKELRCAMESLGIKHADNRRN